jgi:hypothetical protein
MALRRSVVLVHPATKPIPARSQRRPRFHEVPCCVVDVRRTTVRALRGIGCRYAKAGRRCTDLVVWHDSGMSWQLHRSLILMSVDWSTHVVTLYGSDGAVGTAQLPVSPDFQPTRVRKTTWSMPLLGVIVETMDGDEVAFEMPRFDGADQMDGRLVVYLDQCIWRRMADAQDDPSSLANTAEVAAARQLMKLVDERKVTLPLSAGHHTETTHWGNNARRYQLGLTALRLSRGWQMRDPLVIRRQEIKTALLHHIHADSITPALSAFTLQPNAASGRVPPVEAPDGFPPDAVHMMQTLTYLTSTVSVILDAEPILPTTQRLAWVEVNQRFSDWLDTETARPGPQKRKSVDVLLFNDIGQEIAEEAHRAGLQPGQMSGWVHGSMFEDMQDLPSLGIYRSVLQDRHLNVGTTWVANDLTDMLYLSAATGYADVVVAERHMTNMLSQAQRRLRRNASVYPSLTMALPAIEHRLSQAPTTGATGA